MNGTVPSRWVSRAHAAFVPAIFILAVAAYILIYGWLISPRSPVTSDGLSYFVYLPAWVIYQDPSLEDVANHRFGGGFPSYSGILRWPQTGRWINPHPMGVAVMLLPFYLVGHVVTLVKGYPVDGFSLFYRHAAGLGGVCYLTAGIWLLKRLLDRHWSRGVVAATLVSITFGTNLFHYGTFDALWSHVYSFALFAALMNLVEAWNERPTVGRSITAGAIIGLIFLVRHTNLPFSILLLLLYGAGTSQPLAARTRWLGSQGKPLAIIAVSALLVALPQFMSYWSATGRVMLNPYARLMEVQGFEMFRFLHPHFVGVLVGLPKGLFFWSPVLLASVAGLFLLRGRPRDFLLPAVVYLPLNAWVIASWFDWQAGGSFGHRSFTESLAVMALPMAAAYAWAGARPKVAFVVGVIGTAAVALSVLQMVQYWLGILPYSDITWAQYRALFLQFRR